MSLSTLRNDQDLERGIFAGFYRAFTQAEVDGAPKQPFIVTKDGVRQPFDVAKDSGTNGPEWSFLITYTQFQAAVSPCNFYGEVIYARFGCCQTDGAKIAWDSLMGTDKWANVAYRTDKHFQEAWDCFIIILYR